VKEKNASRSKPGPSLHDVAKRAGVSPASVSRVLNGVQPISERLRASVELAVRELGYVPRNPLPARDSSTLAVFATDLVNPVFTEIIAGIEDRAASHSVGTILFDLRGGRTPWEQVRNSYAGHRPLGHIVLGTGLNEQTLLELATHGDVPLVVVNHIIRHPAIRSINIDHAKASHSAASHLINLRHRKLVFLGGSPSSLVIVEKMKGVRKAMLEAGLEFHDESVMTGQSTIEWGFQAMKSLLGRPSGTQPTAVVCSCDLIALGVLHAIRSSGLAVPRDISVVGFDDIAMACHSNPALTTISPPKHEMGTLAVDLFFPRDSAASRINDYVMLESPLVIRESTAACPGTGD
jgi:LacI family transcriptional regulator